MIEYCVLSLWNTHVIYLIPCTGQTRTAYDAKCLIVKCRTVTWGNKSKFWLKQYYDTKLIIIIIARIYPRPMVLIAPSGRTTGQSFAAVYTSVHHTTWYTCMYVHSGICLRVVQVLYRLQYCKCTVNIAGLIPYSFRQAMQLLLAKNYSLGTQDHI